jgi:hypothetical protein
MDHEQHTQRPPFWRSPFGLISTLLAIAAMRTPQRQRTAGRLKARNLPQALARSFSAPGWAFLPRSFCVDSPFLSWLQASSCTVLA